GTSTYYAIAFDTIGAASRIVSGTNTFVPDTRSPEVLVTTFELDAVQEQAAILFDEQIFAGSGNASLLNLNTNVTTTPTVLSIAGSTVRFDLSPGLLADGNYVLTVPEGFVTDDAGNDAEAATLSFFVLRGDLDRDRDVDLTDAALLERNFGDDSNPLYTEGDVNYDGVVNLTDAALLERNFGSTLPAIPTLSAGPTNGAQTTGPTGRLPFSVAPLRGNGSLFDNDNDGDGDEENPGLPGPARRFAR
ncbi:MAG: dockerin type I domain-containing protein, partial [Planctomycetota bacterium]